MISNSDMPAMPQTWVPDYGNKPPVVAGGLTKREDFAKTILSGLVANPNTRQSMHDGAVVTLSIKLAADLLAALEPANDNN